jgi:hypothetical protein
VTPETLARVGPAEAEEPASSPPEKVEPEIARAQVRPGRPPGPVLSAKDESRRTGASAAYVASVEGRVECAKAGGDRWFLAREGAPLQLGDRVRTKLSRARVAFDSGSVLYVNRWTTLTLSEERAAPGLSMVGGDIFVETVPAHRGFTVETPHGRAVDLGTRFGVDVEAVRTTIVVIEGKVEASTDAGEVEIGQAQGSVLTRLTGRPEAPRAVRDASDRFAWTEGLRQEPSEPARLPRRITGGLRALYVFAEGAGEVVGDVSGAGDPLDLTIADREAAEWLEGGGLSVRRPTIISSGRPAAKIISACRAAGEVTVEAWVRPADTSQAGPARIVTLSRNTSQSNLLLGMNWSDTGRPRESYTARLRTTETRASGSPLGIQGSPPLLSTPPGTAALRRTHVVLTRSASGSVSLYLDGREAASRRVGGDLSNWDGSFRLALADELTRDRPWRGIFYLVAVYDRALTAREVAENFLAGVPKE